MLHTITCNVKQNQNEDYEIKGKNRQTKAVKYRNSLWQDKQIEAK